MKFSFIIPVYNTGHLVEKCIQSVLESQIESYEIICINDGSTDNSWEVMQSFKESYPKLKLITKSNGGLSDTRNKGIDLASGDYLMFLDSDDWVDGQKLKELSSYCDYDVDIVHGNFLYAYDTKEDVRNKDQLELRCSGQEFINQALLQDKLSLPVCMNFYKSSFLKNNGLTFKVGIFHEDEEFNLRAYSYANLISSHNIYFYYYLQRESSITNDDRNVPKRLEDIVNIYTQINEFLTEKEHISTTYRQTCQTYLSFILVFGYAKIKNKTLAKTFKQQIKRMKIHQTVHSPILMYRLSKVLMSISPSIFLFLFRHYFQLRNKKI